MNYKELYDKWLNDSHFDEETKNELREIASNDEEIKDRFYQNLEFGTAGIRGIMGAGTNRINRYVISKVTQGLANYILDNSELLKENYVVIAYDSRHNSKLYAETTALVLNANGIKTYIFDDLKPTPLLSFAVRYLKCNFGIVITSSHNPKEYNGYKVYSKDGGQITYPIDEVITNYINKITDYNEILTMPKDKAIRQGLYKILDNRVEDEFVKLTKNNIFNETLLSSMGSNLKTVYTPLHGTGKVLVKRVLEESGFTNLFIVPEQTEPDPNFTTAPYPNPEEEDTFNLAKEMAFQIDADIIIATDPDSDRLGIMVKDNLGDYELLSGNIVGALFSEFILNNLKSSNSIPKNGVLIKSIVSTSLVDVIAKYYNIETIEVLTGCKFIAEKISEFEKTNLHTFIFGFEESIGYMYGDYVRDKNGVSAALLICEIALYLKIQNSTIYEYIENLYRKYGYFKEKTISLKFDGIDGLKKMETIMANFRDNDIQKIDSNIVTTIIDYSISKSKDIKNNIISDIDIPKSNVLRYILEDDSWFIIRPSGTEPKIKLYFGVKGSSRLIVDQKITNIINYIKKMIE